ncbi:MAG: hypothetical protein J1E39_07710 [Eubacterium sp.]|nr:hypothetical protein [Eubacterium sp.]
MSNINSLLEAVSQKLGTTPDKLREALNSGDLSKAIGNMSEKDAQKLNSVLKNPELVKKVMNSKQAQEIRKSLEK